MLIYLISFVTGDFWAFYTDRQPNTQCRKSKFSMYMLNLLIRCIFSCWRWFLTNSTTWTKPRRVFISSREVCFKFITSRDCFQHFSCVFSLFTFIVLLLFFKFKVALLCSSRRYFPFRFVRFWAETPQITKHLFHIQIV